VENGRRRPAEAEMGVRIGYGFLSFPYLSPSYFSILQQGGAYDLTNKGKAREKRGMYRHSGKYGLVISFSGFS
jgi:hypothetical protein